MGDGYGHTRKTWSVFERRAAVYVQSCICKYLHGRERCAIVDNIQGCPYTDDNGMEVCWCCEGAYPLSKYLEFIGYANYRGQKLMLSSNFAMIFDCQHEKLGPMHHLGDGPEGKNIHYCPTGFIYCPGCTGVGYEPEPYECIRWEE